MEQFVKAFMETIQPRLDEAVSKAINHASGPVDDDDMINIQEVMEITGYALPTIYKYTSLNLIPGVWRRGKRLWFSKAALLEWMKNDTGRTVGRPKKIKDDGNTSQE